MTINDQDQEFFKSYGSKDIVDSYGSVERATAYRDRTYLDIEPNRSVRPSFNKSDYYSFRSTEIVPSQQKRIIKQSMDAYDRVGIVRNVIDLMGDFACQGITLVHENKTIERFYRKWFKEVGGIERSERFCNYLFRHGNPIVRRSTAKISNRKEKELRSAAADDIYPEEVSVRRREIPWHYEFLNPVACEYKKTGVGQYKLVMNLNASTIQDLKRQNNAYVLSDELRNKIENGQTYVDLDPNSVSVYHYKKDDWLLWANPMIYAILDDIFMLEKMKLADLAALDGAISNIRLWTLGDLEHKIAPKKAILNKLREILASNVGGGTMDLVWGPELKFTESNSQIYKFLGSEKYQPVLTSIYAGLGIPPTLTGAAGSSGGFTNNYVSLKTLIERLEYGRSILLTWWQKELEIVQKAMGFKKPAQIHFDSIVLSDEAAMKKLMIDLVDRNIISNETLLERMREMPEIEKIRVKREEKARNEDNAIPDKASPFHSPQHAKKIAEISAQRGALDKPYYDKLEIPYKEPAGPLGAGGLGNPAKPKDNPSPFGGRPLNSKDSTKRAQKRVLPRSSAEIAVWAIAAQKEISDVLNPFALAHFNKKDLRALTNDEVKQIEDLKLSVLVNLEPCSSITPEAIFNSINSQKTYSSEFINTVNEKVEEFMLEHSEKPNLEQMKHIYAMCYAELV
jgi:hypothetical protein